jgi:hypothetical protein
MSYRPLSRRSLLRRAAALGAASLLSCQPIQRLRAAPALRPSLQTGLRLVNPRLAHPVFAEPGGTFFVEVRAAANLDPGGWRVQLATDLGASWSVLVVDAKATTVDYDRADGWRLVVQPPAGLPPELFTLVVRHTALAEEVREPRSVSLVTDLNADWYALHLTDEHVLYDSIRHYACDDPASGYRSADLVRWATPVVNLLNPRLVINSGDQAHQYATTGYRYSYNADIYRCYLQAKAGYRVPSLMLLGNHEVNEKDAAQRARDWARWEGLAGRRFFHLRVGSLWFFAHDYLDPASRVFIDRLYRSSFANLGVEGRVFVQHHTSEQGYRPTADYAPTLMLIGHFHRQSVEDRWPYPILMGAAAHRYATGSVIRFTRRDGRWQSDAADRWGLCDVGLVGDYGAPMASATFATPNDGRARANSVDVRNRLPQRFPDGRVRLLLAEGRYALEGGDVLAQYAVPGGRTVTLVRVDIPANGTRRLEVREQTASHFLVTLPETPVPERLDETPVAVSEAGDPLLPSGPTDTVIGPLAPDDPGATRDEQPHQLFLPLG